MDVGDGFYKLGVSALTIISVVSQLLSVVVLLCGLCGGYRSRRILATAALLILAADHIFVAWTGLWRDVLLGIDRDGSWDLIWATVFAILALVILSVAAQWLLTRPKHLKKSAPKPVLREL
jgi:hypothetical protein